VETIENLFDDAGRSQHTIRSRRFIFLVHLVIRGATRPVVFAEKGRLSIVVIELEEVGFKLRPAEPEIAKDNIAESLARQIALMAVEKDLPRGIELSFSAKRIDQIPPECENRLPDFWVDGNDVWFVDSPPHKGEFSPSGMPECNSGFCPQAAGYA
jgi:hypothetical protein